MEVKIKRYITNLGRLLCRMVVAPILSGAISAIGGAAAFHYWDAIKDRKRIWVGVHAELYENCMRVEEQIEKLEEINNWNGRLEIDYTNEVFNAAKSNSGIYIKILTNLDYVIRTYHSINYWKTMYESLQQAGASSNLDEEEMIEILKYFNEDLKMAVLEIEEHLESGFFRRLLYQRNLIETTEIEPIDETPRSSRQDMFKD